MKAGEQQRPLGSAEEERFIPANTSLLSPALARAFGLEEAVAYGEPTTGNSSGDVSASASARRGRQQQQHAGPALNALAGTAHAPWPAAAALAGPSVNGARGGPDRPASATGTSTRGASTPATAAGGYAKRARGAPEEVPAPPPAAAEEAGTGKRPRLVWSPALHARFVDAVTHLGIKAAVPKTIMQMMNVEGLTRENVASHLQKFRLYTRRLNDAAGGHGGADDGEDGDDGDDDGGGGASGGAP